MFLSDKYVASYATEKCRCTRRSTAVQFWNVQVNSVQFPAISFTENMFRRYQRRDDTTKPMSAFLQLFVAQAPARFPSHKFLILFTKKS
jgi:hypothetical protein